MADHVFRRFDEELDKLRTRLIKMGSVVQEQVEFVFRALETSNVELAKLVIGRDEKVDTLDIKIDKQCMRLFALQQPVAIDLRLIMSALSINNNFERIGDLAVNIAERTLTLAILPDVLSRTRILEMGKQAEQMVVKALDAFINNDVELARAVLAMDTIVDQLDQVNFQTLLSIMTEDKALIEPCSHLVIVSRNIERLADQATNISEEVVFLVDAEIIKHRNWDEEKSGT